MKRSDLRLAISIIARVDSAEHRLTELADVEGIYLAPDLTTSKATHRKFGLDLTRDETDAVLALVKGLIRFRIEKANAELRGLGVED